MQCRKARLSKKGKESGLFVMKQDRFMLSGILIDRIGGTIGNRYAFVLLSVS